MRRGRKQNGLIFYEKKKVLTGALVAELLSWLFYTAVAVVIAYLLVLGFGYRMHMTGVAMTPEIADGESLFLDRVSYRLRAPKRGDIIAFYPNGNENARVMVRRIVALPGETVRIEDGTVFIDDRAESNLDHRYDKIADAGIAAGGVTLGSKEYFVLGDLRNASEDSRSANIGAVNAAAIVGRVWFHYGSSER